MILILYCMCLNESSRTLQSRHSCVSIGQREWQMNRRSGAANEEGPPPTKCPKVDAASVEVNSKSINKEDRLIWVDLEVRRACNNVL